MRVVIIEDETAAAQNLEAILNEVIPSAEILCTIESVAEAIDYFGQQTNVDLIFMDIHLADGSAFRIFDRVKITVPIIFTTAYDRYALEAFKVSSIDYILKPISAEAIARTMEKLHGLTSLQIADSAEKISAMAEDQNRLSSSLIVHSRDRLIPITLEQIAYFYTQQGSTTLHTLTGESHPIDKSLDMLQGSLPECDFIRANRQYIVARTAVKDMSIWFGSRLSLNLNVSVPERIIIAKAKVGEFKRWVLNKS